MNRNRPCKKVVTTDIASFLESQPYQLSCRFEQTRKYQIPLNYYTDLPLVPIIMFGRQNSVPLFFHDLACLAKIALPKVN